MKVTHVIPDLRTGGAQRFVTDLAIALSDFSDMEISVVVYKSVKDSPFERMLTNHPRIRFINLDIKNTRGLSPVFRLTNEIRRANVAHIHLFPALYQAAGASLLTGTPVIFTEHSTCNRRRSRRYLQPVERCIYNIYGSICAVSDAALRNLTRWLNLPQDTHYLHVIPNGVNIDDFNVEKPNDTLLPSIFGRKGRAILMVSCFVEAKDQDTLIRAVKYLKNPDLFVAFAGDGPMLENCKRLAEESGVRNRIEFLGNRDDIPRLIAASHIGVQSSVREGFGLSVVEMMAGGLPVIASDVPGMRETVEGAGILFPPGDEKALAEKINALLCPEIHTEIETAEKIAELKAAGKKRAMEYSISTAARKYADLYRQYPH